ncbi:hypothetical protein CHELA40_14648 [Chelatococcus asaccharovorans]|nr:hypothetical protein CHELA17_60970 [Chelatococcus asaccharovorans]CAH1679001.1 hypothetical protein CHELA40_14648 [Chelatococcus asaccharovorans]
MSPVKTVADGAAGAARDAEVAAIWAFAEPALAVRAVDTPIVASDVIRKSRRPGCFSGLPGMIEVLTRVKSDVFGPPAYTLIVHRPPSRLKAGLGPLTIVNSVRHCR